MIQVFIAILILLATYIPYDTSNWYVVTQNCSQIVNDNLVMDCASSGYVYKVPVDLNHKILVRVRARAGAAKSFWLSLALNSNVKDDNQYASIAIQRNTWPYANYPDRTLITYLNGGTSDWLKFLTEANVDQWYYLQMVYDHGKVSYFVDNQWYTDAYVDLGKQTYIEVLCGSGVAHCEFEPVYINYALDS